MLLLRYEAQALALSIGGGAADNYLSHRPMCSLLRRRWCAFRLCHFLIHRVLGFNFFWAGSRRATALLPDEANAAI